MPVHRPGRWLDVAATIVATLLLLAVLKPWDGSALPASPPGQPPPQPTASAGPAPTADLTPEGLAASVCLGTDDWRIASVETWQLVVDGSVRHEEVRVWRSVSPTTAAYGPDDPSIPITVVAADAIDELGWCAPATGAGRVVGPAELSVWRLGPGGSATVVTVRRVAPALGMTPYAALYREVTDCVAGSGCTGSGMPRLASGWAPDRYVFEYHDLGTGGSDWFSADVETLPGPTPAP